MIRKSVYALFMITFLFILCGCGSALSAKDEKNDSFKFESDSKLSEYLNKEKIIDNAGEDLFGAVGPRLAYVNDNYAVIMNYNYILIYDLKIKKLSGAIDNGALGMDKMQGSTYTKIIGNDDYIFIFESDKTNSGYVYSLKNDEMEKVEGLENIDEIFTENPAVSESAFDKLSAETTAAGDNYFFSALQNENEIIALIFNSNSFDSWKIIILSDSLELTDEFYLQS